MPLFRIRRYPGRDRRRPRRLWVYYLAVLVSGLLAGTSLHALPPWEVQLLVSGRDDQDRAIVAALKRHLARGTPPARMSIFNLDKEPVMAGREDQLIIAIGPEAAREAMTRFPASPLLALAVSRAQWRALTQEFPGGRCMAVLSDQPARRLLNAATLISLNHKTIGTVFGPGSRHMETELISVLGEQQRLVHRHLGDDDKDNRAQALTGVFESSELFLALPDRSLYDPSTSHWVLYVSFRYKIPVIGFSLAQVRAGALASVFSSPDDIARQGAELVHEYLLNPAATLWEPHDPDYFTVEVNPSVARALAIPLPRPATLYREMARLEQEAPQQ